MLFVVKDTLRSMWVASLMVSIYTIEINKKD